MRHLALVLGFDCDDDEQTLRAVWQEHRDLLMGASSGEVPFGFWLFEAEAAGAPKRLVASVDELGPTPLAELEREAELALRARGVGGRAHAQAGRLTGLVGRD